MQVHEQVTKLDEILAEYESLRGLRPWKNVDITRYVEMSSDELRNLTREELALGVCSLAQFSLALQKELNKEKTRYDWAQGRIDLIYWRDCEKYRKDFQTKDERKGQIIVQNDVLTKLHQVMCEAQNRMNRLNEIPEKIDGLRRAIENLCFIRKDQ